MNQDENDLVGFFEVGTYLLVDSTIRLSEHLPTLKLNKDKTFILELAHEVRSEKWGAYDNGDRTLVNFYFNGTEISCQVKPMKFGYKTLHGLAVRISKILCSKEK